MTNGTFSPRRRDARIGGTNRVLVGVVAVLVLAAVAVGSFHRRSRLAEPTRPSSAARRTAAAPRRPSTGPAPEVPGDLRRWPAGARRARTASGRAPSRARRSASRAVRRWASSRATAKASSRARTRPWAASATGRSARTTSKFATGTDGVPFSIDSQSDVPERALRDLRRQPADICTEPRRRLGQPGFTRGGRICSRAVGAWRLSPVGSSAT